MRADVIILALRFLSKLLFIALFMAVLFAGVAAIDYFDIRAGLQALYSFGLALVLSFVVLAAKKVDAIIKAL